AASCPGTAARGRRTRSPSRTPRCARCCSACEGPDLPGARVAPRVWLLLLWLALAVVQAAVHDQLVDTPLEGMRLELHRQTVELRAPAPAQYRVLLPFAAAGLMRLGVPFRIAYLLLQVAFTWLTAVLFHHLLS